MHKISWLLALYLLSPVGYSQDKKVEEDSIVEVLGVLSTSLNIAQLTMSDTNTIFQNSLYCFHTEKRTEEECFKQELKYLSYNYRKLFNLLNSKVSNCNKQVKEKRELTHKIREQGLKAYDRYTTENTQFLVSILELEEYESDTYVLADFVSSYDKTKSLSDSEEQNVMTFADSLLVSKFHSKQNKSYFTSASDFSCRRLANIYQLVMNKSSLKGTQEVAEEIEKANQVCSNLKKLNFCFDDFSAATKTLRNTIDSLNSGSNYSQKYDFTWKYAPLP